MFREFVLSNPSLGPGSPAIDTCSGDSGGPVYWFAQRYDHEGNLGVHRFLVGITSRALAGVDQSFGQCGGGGVYTAVVHGDVLAWLAGLGIHFSFGIDPADFAEVPVATDNRQ
jgi:secreted trypsin-like serine protease